MTDPTIPINSVDALHAHFAEWVRFLDAKGKELEAQLAKLEASKKKKANGTDTTSAVSTPQKTLSTVPSISINITKEDTRTDTMDWLDEGDGVSGEADIPTPQMLPQGVELSKIDEPSPETGRSTDGDDRSPSETNSASESDAMVDENDPLYWLEET